MRLFDPLGGLLCTEIVEHEQISRHDRSQNFQLCGANRRVVGAPDHAQQVTGIVKETPCASRLHNLPEHGHRQVGLADPGLPFEQQSLADDRKRLCNAARLRRRPLERLVIRRKIRDRAVLIPLWDVGRDESQLPEALAPAIAARDAPYAGGIARNVDRFPPGVVAQRTRHGLVAKQSEI